MSKPTLSAAALALGLCVTRVLEGYAYPRNGNTMNPTPRYRWEVRNSRDRILGTYGSAGAAIELANDYAEDPR